MVFCPLFGCLFVSAHYICIRVVWIEKTRSLTFLDISHCSGNQGLVTWLLLLGTPGLECVIKKPFNSRSCKGWKGHLTRLLPQRTELCSSSSITWLWPNFWASVLHRFLMNSMNSPINMLLLPNFGNKNPLASKQLQLLPIFYRWGKLKLREVLIIDMQIFSDSKTNDLSQFFMMAPLIYLFIVFDFDSLSLRLILISSTLKSKYKSYKYKIYS